MSEDFRGKRAKLYLLDDAFDLNDIEEVGYYLPKPSESLMLPNKPITPICVVPTFIMMVGLPASCKSTYAKELAEKYNANIHASDDIREELSGDVNNQDINDLVFKTLHSRIKQDLSSCKSCIYDATNISYKRRKSFLQELKDIPCYKMCVLMATPYEQCLENNKKRDRQVPEEVIKRMYMNFDVPYWYEGWSAIQIKYYENSKDSYGLPSEWVKEKAMNFNQENKHHSLTLGQHCLEAWRFVSCDNGYGIEYKDSKDWNSLYIATKIHDCGKPKTKVFHNTKGEPTKEAHYYNHDRVGAYESLFFEHTANPLRVATLIRWHMQPYFCKTEKSINKYRNLWGEELYNDIMRLHKADVEAH